MKNWNIVKLGEVLEQDKSCAVTIKPDSTYEMVGVYSFGRGLFQKEKLLGMNTSYKFFYQLNRNHIVMSQLFGWEGALALIWEKFENKYVSSMFPTFLTNNEIAHREYIGHFLQKKRRLATTF